MPKKPLIFIIFLVVLTGIIGFGPLLIPPTNPFYNIDPETAYIANALEFIQVGKIDYYGHPGTPVIILLGNLFSYLKAFQVFSTQDFVQWALIHYQELFWLSRGYFFLLFLIGNLLIHLSVYKQFKSLIVNFFLFVIFFLDPSFQEMSTKVASEPIGLLLFSFWLISFLAHQNARRTKDLLLMALFAGILVANKFVYAPIAIASLIIVVFQKKHMLSGLVVVLLGFFLATLPIINNYPKLATWLVNLTTKTGVYGTGGPGLIDPKLYIESASYWINDRLATVLLILTTAICTLRAKSDKNWKILSLTGLIGFFLFMKYPAARYQAGNILLLLISTAYIFSGLRKQVQILLLLVFFVPALIYGSHDFNFRRNLVKKAAHLQSFIDSLPKTENIVWEYAESRDFALIRARNDSGYFISPQLKIIKPHMWELVSQTLTDIRNNKDETFDISCLCWDGIVMQKRSYSIFISKQNNVNLFLTENIPGTDMLYIKRNNL